MLKLPMAVIAVSASFSLSQAFNSADEMCAAFASEMSEKYKEDALREMGRKTQDFEGYRFIDRAIHTHNQNMVTLDYDTISKIKGNVEVEHDDDFNGPSTPGGPDYGKCKFSALSVDNPTPGIDTKTIFSMNYYKIKR